MWEQDAKQKTKLIAHKEQSKVEYNSSLYVFP